MTFDFSVQFRAAGAYSNQQFAMLMLGNDYRALRLTGAQREELIAGAMQCGMRAGVQLRERFAQAKPSEMVCGLKMTIEARELTNIVPVLAGYDPVAELVMIDHALLMKLQQYCEQHQLLPPFDPVELVIAYELFPWLEAREHTIFTRRFKATMWRLGTLQYRSTIPAASEIAAASCAKALCHLCFNPILLEVLVLHLCRPETGQEWFGKLQKVSCATSPRRLDHA